jgi:hypothetical protein
MYKIFKKIQFLLTLSKIAEGIISAIRSLRDSSQSIDFSCLQQLFGTIKIVP